MMGSERHDLWELWADASDSGAQGSSPKKGCLVEMLGEEVERRPLRPRPGLDPTHLQHHRLAWFTIAMSSTAEAHVLPATVPEVASLGLCLAGQAFGTL